MNGCDASPKADETFTSPLTVISDYDSLFGRAKNRGRNTESQNISPCALSTLTIEEWETADSVQACCMGECESTEAGELGSAQAFLRESTLENNITSQSSQYTSPAVESCHIFDGEFDPGSGPTLAACVTHASRTQAGQPALRGGRVRNTWAT